MSLYFCLVPKMANAVVLWVIVNLCVTSVNTKDMASTYTQAKPPPAFKHI